MENVWMSWKDVRLVGEGVLLVRVDFRFFSNDDGFVIEDVGMIEEDVGFRVRMVNIGWRGYDVVETELEKMSH
jgi:hypothetical protein